MAGQGVVRFESRGAARWVMRGAGQLQQHVSSSGKLGKGQL